jgi:hypothetical protein
LTIDTGKQWSAHGTRILQIGKVLFVYDGILK